MRYIFVKLHKSLYKKEKIFEIDGTKIRSSVTCGEFLKHDFTICDEISQKNMVSYPLVETADIR